MEKEREKRTWWYVALGVSAGALVVSFIAPLRGHWLLRWFDFGWIAIILCAYPIFYTGIKSVIHGKVTSELLIALSIVACVTLEFLTLSGVLPGDGHGHSNIFAAGEVAFLMSVGELIEDITVAKARGGIEKLSELAPSVAKYNIDGNIVEKQLSEVKIGDEVVVMAGDMISVDGVIIDGETTVDEQILTGESVPVDKKIGDNVFGGTMNTAGALTIRVSRTSDEMAVEKLKKLVEEAEGKKAPISKIADRLAKYIVPLSIIISVFAFLFSMFFLKKTLAISALRGITILVVFCPCALALATPTAIAAALGSCAKQGILVKSGGAIESLARVKTVALDKTGTLTVGRLCVVDVFVDGVSTRHLEAIAGACESLSTHPIAIALVKHCKNHTTLPSFSDSKNIVGEGVSATVFGKKCMAIKWASAVKMGVKCEAAESLASAHISSGKTVVAILEDGKFIGFFALSDEAREGAKQAIDELKSQNISAVMLTGDNEGAAKNIAEKIGISYMAAMSPQDKLAEIESLKSAGVVAMVGDGVNDAPALAAADVSVAMGALSSGVALEAADASIMNSDITKISSLTSFSKKTLKTIKINIIFSLIVSFISVILSVAGILEPISGALVHNVSSIFVVINSATLLIKKRFNLSKK